MVSYRAMASALGMGASTACRVGSPIQWQRAQESGRIPYGPGLDGKQRPLIRYDTSERDEVIRERRMAGLSVRAIAAEVGVSVGTVHRVLVNARSQP
jgi:DNA invertase Pin-like site-specific DNA recombinase